MAGSAYVHRMPRQNATRSTHGNLNLRHEGTRSIVCFISALRCLAEHQKDSRQNIDSSHSVLVSVRKGTS